MTMNYCGRCGAANGTAARYCRQCGAELHNQAAFSSNSSPLNVEFSARNASKEQSEITGTAGTAREIPPPPAPPPYPSSPKASGQTSGKKDGGDRDPKAISESLKKLRASGPLLAEAAKDKKKQERINQIIASSIEGKDEKKSEAKSHSIAHVTQALSKAKPKPAAEIIAPATGSSASPASVAPRKISTPLPAPATTGATNGAAVVTRNGGALSGASQLPPHGPSSVLAQASGLGKQSNLGSRVRIALIAVIVILAAGSYLLLRDRLTGPSRLTDSGRNLLSAEEQSAFLVRMGQRDREQGHSEAAIGYFKTALSLTPNNPDIYFLLGQTYAGAGHSDEAMKSYQSLLRIVPDHLEARLQIAEIHRARGNWNAALQEYQRIIALDQNSPQAAAALSVMESQDTGKPEIADANFRRPRNVVKKVPVALPGAVAQAKVSLMLPGQVATRIQPPTPSAMTGRPEERPDPRAIADSHKKLGLRYLGVRQYRAAINEFLSALRLTPEDKDIYYFLGSSYYGLGELALAHDYYKRVDSGNYVGVAQSGAKNTEKAAREEAKRRELLKNDPLNQVKNDLNQKSKGRLNNSLE